MVDPRTAARLSYRALYLALAFLGLFVRLLPLSAAPQPWPLPEGLLRAMPGWMLPAEWPGPDVLLALTILWVQRRPDFIPAPMIALVFFLDDLMTMRPPGLWALVVLTGTEVLRARETGMRDLPFWGEWLVGALAMTAMVLAYRFLLALFIVPGVSLGPAILNLVATVALYPVLALALQVAFGLSRTATGEVDALGQRL